MKKTLLIIGVLLSAVSCKKELAEKHLGDYEGTYHNTAYSSQYPTVTIQFKEYSSDKNKMDVYAKNNGLFMFTLKMIDENNFVVEGQNCGRYWSGGRIVSGNGKFSGTWVDFGVTHESGNGAYHLYEEFGGRKQ